jgi:phosphate acetyltransferase
MPLPDSAVEFLQSQADRVRALPKRPKIVFPEGEDSRVREAAARLAHEGLVDPVLITDPSGDSRLARYASILLERRRAKGMTQVEASQQAAQPLMFGCLMVAAGDADGFVGGAVNNTADTVRAALHAIGPRPDVRTVSTFMILCVRDRGYGQDGLLVIADPAMVVDPAPAELADITIATARSARALLGIEPVVAMLSFSTKGSAHHKKAGNVIEACAIVRARAPELNVDAELQADAALVASVGASKAPGSAVAGRANTLIFPDINAANIGYKLVERLGGAAAIGPFLQGLARPANDLSRGCSADDIYGAALVTALQSAQDAPARSI